MLVMQGGDWVRESLPPATYAGVAYTVQRYRPRIEGLFARIERWTNHVDRSSFWRSISKDNVTSLYGIDSDGRIADPADPSRIFNWLLQQSYDDKGNVVVYGYEAENRDNVPAALHESNRTVGAQRYLKYIRYGNTTPYYPDPLTPASLVVAGRLVLPSWSSTTASTILGRPLMPEDAGSGRREWIRSPAIARDSRSAPIRLCRAC